MKKIALFLAMILILSMFSFLTATAADAVIPDPNPSGDYLKYNVSIKKPEGETLTYNFTTVKLTDYVIQEGDKLEYDVRSDIEETGWGAIDGEIATIGTIRDTPGIIDQNDVGIHTGQDLSFYVYNKWYHRVLNIATTADETDKPTVGQKITEIQLAMHPTSDVLEYQGTVLYDNIVITNNAEVKYVVFQNAADVDPTKFKKHHDKNNETTAVVEVLTFSADEENAYKAELQAIKDAEAKAIEEASIRKESEEQSRVEAEFIRASSEQSSIEQASIDASNAANITEAPEEEESGSNMVLIIVISVVVVVIAVVVIIVVVSNNKKKSKPTKK